MKHALIAAARRVRHLPGLERIDGLWGAARGVYRYALDPRRRGVAVPVGRGAGSVRVPREFLGNVFDEEEPETVAAVLDHLKTMHTAGTTDLEVVDVGCSHGLFTAVALSSDAVGRVIAVDSQPMALVASRRLCRHLGPDRLVPLRAFIDLQTTAGETGDSLFARTASALAPHAADGGPVDADYVCLGEEGAAEIPAISLDDLLARTGPPLLIKIDIEGGSCRPSAGPPKRCGPVGRRSC